MRVILLIALSLVSLSVVAAQQQQCGGVELGKIYANRTLPTVSSLTSAGWQQCFLSSYSQPIGTTNLPMRNCNTFTHVLYGCITLGNSRATVAAAAPYSLIFTESSNAASDAGLVFGTTSFYYTSSYSMGFAPAGQPVNRVQCDQFNTAATDRVCYHLLPAGSTGGRCGSATSLGTSENVQRIAWGLNCAPPNDPCVENRVHFKPCQKTRLVSSGTVASFDFVQNGGVDCIVP